MLTFSSATCCIFPPAFAIIQAGYIQPFSYFRDKLDRDDRILVASIPFVRNLLEFTVGTSDAGYILLTSLLHIKESSEEVTRGELEQVYCQTFCRKVELGNAGQELLQLIRRLGDEVAAEGTVGINLENKIVLSMAIRLRAERYMLDKINDPAAAADIRKNQTYELSRLFRKKRPDDDVANDVLSQVNLMTPEHIHVNSFMYEPILDMSDEHLRVLLADVKALK